MSTYYDSFTDTDAVQITSHTPDTGGGGTWTGNSQGQIQGNVLTTAGALGDGYDQFPLASGDAPSAVQLTFKTIDTAGNGQSTFLAMRLTDNNNFVGVRAATSNSTYQLYYRSAGTFNLVASGGVAPANGDVVLLSMTGDSFTVTVNSSIVISAQTITFNSSEKKVGLALYFPDGSTIDDYYVTYTPAGGGGGGTTPPIGQGFLVY